MTTNSAYAHSKKDIEQYNTDDVSFASISINNKEIPTSTLLKKRNKTSDLSEVAGDHAAKSIKTDSEATPTSAVCSTDAVKASTEQTSKDRTLPLTKDQQKLR